jgi:hypothetical protein
MADFTGRVVNQDNEPIDGAQVSLEFRGTPPVVFTDSHGIYRFTVSFIGSGSINGRIRVEASGYRTNTRYIELSPNNTTIEEFRLVDHNVSTRPIPIKVAIIGAIGVIVAAFVTSGLPFLQKLFTPELKDNKLPSEKANPSAPISSPPPKSTELQQKPIIPLPTVDPSTYSPQMFNGIWIGEGYQCPWGTYHTEKIKIEVKNNFLIATKITGDECVPQGNQTFSGIVPSSLKIGSSFSISSIGGFPEKPAFDTASRNLIIINYDKFLTKGESGDQIFFSRSK